VADTVTAFVPVYANLATGRFVAGRKSGASENNPLGLFYSRNNLNLKVYPLVNNPSAGLSSSDPYQVVDVSGLSLVAAILDTSGAVLAQGSTFTADTAQNTLTGALNCDVAAMTTYATDINGKDVIIEFRFTGSFGSRNCRALSKVYKQINVTGTPDPNPTVTYITTNEFETRGLLRDGVAGEVKTWVSSDGSSRGLQYWGNDGVMHFDPI
jgi:hypothetical protein